MKNLFTKISLVIGTLLLMLDYSYTLGVYLGVLILFLISLLRTQLEVAIGTLENFSAKVLFRHFISVIILMALGLLICFFFPEYFNPYAFAGTIIFERIFKYITGIFNRGQGKINV